jgi:hypothetical protein
MSTTHDHYEAPRVESTDSVMALLTWSPHDKWDNKKRPRQGGGGGGGHHS